MAAVQLADSAEVGCLEVGATGWADRVAAATEGRMAAEAMAAETAVGVRAEVWTAEGRLVGAVRGSAAAAQWAEKAEKADEWAEARG